jgi:(E)-4-hydroxy-3-methylbut-2-enyl-diphosphate synthase
MNMSKVVKVGDILIGGGNPVVIQSMTNTTTSDVEATVSQINKLEEAGCQLVRMTINNEEAAKAIGKIKKRVNLPLCADIHFDYKLALLAIENGIDKLRINPGNIGSDENIKAVVEKAKEKNIPIRIGVNSGSIEKHILEKYGKPTADGMVESAMYHINLLEKNGFTDIVVSLKASNVKMMVEAYRKISKLVDYPLHLGVTEAGTAFQGTVKSAIGIGSLLVDGIGDTIRVSLTEDPVEEIKVAKEILKVLGLIEAGVEIISCPTCGRTEIDLIGLAKKVEKEFENEKKKVKIAVMGCVVNGPGEAREADYGVAGGKGVGVLFKKGKIVKKVKESEILIELKKLIMEDEENESIEGNS